MNETLTILEKVNVATWDISSIGGCDMEALAIVSRFDRELGENKLSHDSLRAAVLAFRQRLQEYSECPRAEEC